MRTLIKVGISLLLLAFVLIGVSYGMLRAQGISNPSSAAGRAVRSDTRAIGKDIVNVELSGPIDLTLRQGATASLTVRGEQRLLANIDTSQDGATLHIGPKGMLFHHRHPLTVELVLPSLQQLEVHGSGNSSVSGFNGERFTLRLHGQGNVHVNSRFKHITAGLYGNGELDLNGGNSDSVLLELAGSGSITASGSSKSLRAVLNGPGDLDAEHLASDRVSVLLQGPGAADVFAREAVDLTLHGSGNIHVYGNPQQRKVTSHGSGEVNWD